MKVLFYIRANHSDVKGGDLVQIYSTADALKRLGVMVVFSSDPNKNLEEYDVVHLFNSPRFDETEEFIENAIRQNKHTSFSTIFWPKDELAVGIASSRAVRLCRKILGVRLTLIIWRMIKKRDDKFLIEKRLIEKADMLLPNSDGEMKQIKRVFNLRNKPYKSIVNAIDTNKFKAIPTQKRHNYVLSVGRIENRKNTLKLIKACHNCGYKLTLIGGYDPEDKYALECLKLIEEYKFEHIKNLDHEELLPYFYNAKVHAMVSWYETPGLATMEAACGGCNILTTNRGSVGEYFGDKVTYCDPFSQESIETGLKHSMEIENDLSLRELITEKYTWDKAASQTKEAYLELIS